MKAIDHLNEMILKVLDAFLAIASVIMLAVNLAQVAGRYIFHSSITWSEELSTYMYVWIIFLALFAACKARNELNIDVLQFHNSPKKRRVVVLIREIFSLIALLVFLYGSILMIQNSLAYPQKTASLKIITAYLYFCMPISFSLLSWMKLVNIIHDFRYFAGKEVENAE